MRLFIAVPLPEDTKECLIGIQKQFNKGSSKIAFTKKEHMHLTLKFLGEVPEDRIGIIIEQLKQVRFRPFSFNLSKIGVFPSEQYIRVVWVGIEPENIVIEAQKNVDDAISSLFNSEKDYKPHLTIARVRYLDNKRDFIEKLKKINIEEKLVEVIGFKLIKSVLAPEGPVHEDIESFSFRLVK